MTIQIKHAFTSAKGDGGDATLVRPSNWNAVHTTSMATGQLLGRLTAGSGSFEEIPISTLLANALSQTTGAGFLAALGVGGFKTGDVKFTVDPNAETGWVVCSFAGATVGKVGSGATYAAADAQPLYELCYNNINDTACPVVGGRSGNATTDFNAGKTLQLPWFAGRALMGAGGGGGLTTRALGIFGGNETHTLSVAELALHYHSAGISDPGHAHGTSGSGNGSWVRASAGGSQYGGGGFGIPDGSVTILSSGTNVRVNSSNGLDTTYSTGGNSPHNNMMPFIPLWPKIKL